MNDESPRRSGGSVAGVSGVGSSPTGVASFLRWACVFFPIQRISVLATSVEHLGPQHVRDCGPWPLTPRQTVHAHLLDPWLSGP